jgi:hypothetical protein
VEDIEIDVLNFVHKLHQPESLPWKTWFRRHSAGDLGDSSSTPLFLEKIVAECLPLYRSITRCCVVDGAHTAFWMDRWTSGGCLAAQFPALFSHCTRPNATVAVVKTSGLSLRPRLTGVALAELASLRELIDGLVLRAGCDARFIDLSTPLPFSSRAAYRALSPTAAVDRSAVLAWELRLPNKLKIFSYLADIDRLSTRANLFYKGCAPSDICAAYPAPESSRHLFFDCPLAASLWRRLGISIPAGNFSVWDLLPPPGIADATWRAGVAVLLWSLWKVRNDLVFNGQPSSTQGVLRRGCEDLALWRWRFPARDRAGIDSLRSFLLNSLV